MFENHFVYHYCKPYAIISLNYEDDVFDER